MREVVSEWDPEDWDFGRAVRLDWERAWAAGFYDGEGCTTYGRYRRADGSEKISPCVHVGQNDPEVLYRLQSAVNGLGSVRGPYVRAAGNPYWHYQVSNYEHVQQFIATIWQWLSTEKKEQARRVFTMARESLRA